MYKLLNLKRIHSSENGNLSFFESFKEVPFDIKRIYYTYDVNINTKRGMHAHKQLKQAIWCPFGKIEIILDNGKCVRNVFLNSPEKLLIIEPGIWRDIYWRQEGSVLCVAASDYYKEDDYIRDYNEFKRLVEKRYWSNENKF